jgi:hydroxyacylglutathione hydrolase
MYIQQFFIPGIAHSSYLIAGDTECAVVDPSRDIDRYRAAARDLGLPITHILETHLHADFVSGHIELAEATGAVIFAPAEGHCTFPHTPVRTGTTFDLDQMTFSVRETRGHTPDCVVYVVTDHARGDGPAAVFTGDTLFVGDIGRPDLFPGLAKELAHQLFESLQHAILTLPDDCLVYPAHGAGSLCGRAMGAMRWSTIGYERTNNPALGISDQEVFIETLTSNMPPAPDHFARCSEINRHGAPPLSTFPDVPALSPQAFAEKMRGGNTVVLGLHNYAGFGGLHIPGSYHIDIGGNFSTFAGWVIPPDRDILLVTDNPLQVPDAAVMLRRVGLDRIAGYLAGGTHAWVTAGYAADHVHQLSPAEVHAMLQRPGVVLVDVRTPEEFAGGHVPGAVNILAMDLRTRYTELDPAAPVIVMCRTGHRSSLASSLLKQQGFRDVYNAAGGITGYIAGGFMTGAAKETYT